MATNSKDPVVMADWLEPGQFVSNVSDVELEIAGWERCDVLTMNRHGRRWMRHAIGGAEAIPEHGKDQYTRPTRIEWDKLPLLGDVIAGNRPGRTSDRPDLRDSSCAETACSLPPSPISSIVAARRRGSEPRFPASCSSRTRNTYPDRYEFPDKTPKD